MNQKDRHQPVIEKDTVNRVETMWPNGYGPEWNKENYNGSTPNYPDSDESDSDEMLPLGAFWPTPEEEEWTIVGKPHGVQRYDKGLDCNRLHYTHDKLDRSCMCCKQLDYIDWNVTQDDSDKLLSERLVTDVGILNTDDVYTRSEVLPTRRNEATQNDSSPSLSWKGQQSHRLTSEPVVTSVRPSIRKRPNVIAVETRKTAGVPTTRPVDIVPIPQVIVDDNCCSGTGSRVKLPKEPDVSPAKIAKEANTGGATNEQHLHDDQNFNKTTNTKLPTDCIEITKPTLTRVSFKVAEEASNDGTTNEQYLYEDQNYAKTTDAKLPMDFLEIPQPSFTRGFLELAEEARNGGVESEPWFLMDEVIPQVTEDQNYTKTTITKLSTDFLEIPKPAFTRRFLELAEEARNGGVESEPLFLVDEVLPQVTGMTKPVIEPVSQLLEEELGQCVEVTREALSRVAPVKYEAGHMMQWPDIKSDGVMIDGIMLESEMSPVGSERGAAEPVLLAAKSEVFTPVVFAGGSLLRQLPWPWWRQSQREFLSYQWLKANFQPVYLRPSASRSS